MNLTIGNTTTVTSLTGLRLNVITLAGQQGPQGPAGAAGTGSGGTGAAFNGDVAIPYDTVSNTLSLFNQTKAVATGNAYSPFIKQEGFSWKTAAGGSSISVEARQGVKTERSFAGGGAWMLETSLASGNWITGLKVDSQGVVTTSEIDTTYLFASTVQSDQIIAANNALVFQTTGNSNRNTLSTVFGPTDSSITFDARSGARMVTLLGDSTLSGTGVPTSRTINSIPLTGNVVVTATDIPVGIVPGAGYSNLQQFINTMHSPGLIDGGVISDAGGGTMHITPGTGMLRIADDNVSSLLFVSMTGTNISVPQDLIQYYVGFVYNSGAPMYQMRSSNNWDNDTEIALGTIVNFFGTLIPSNNPYLVGDPITNIIQRFDAIAPITRDQTVGGLNLGEAGTRNILLSAGKLWTRLNDYSVPALDSSAGTVMYAAYYNGFYWNYLTNITQWDNTSYNDITQGLVPITPGYYSNLWFYLTVETNSLGWVYDQHQYGDLTSASLAQAPSFLPANFTNGSILLGRLLFNPGATVADAIDSAFVATFSSSPVTAHNQLAGLQGGNASEYYHLSQSDYSVLTGRAGSTIVNSINGINGTALITGAQGITVSRSGQLITVSGQDWATNSSLATTGSSLYATLTGLSGQANTNYATVANLALTGSGLNASLVAASGQLGVNLTNTGIALGARDTLISGIAATGLTNTGAALYNLITQASGAANASYATIAQYTGLSGALGVTGSTLDTKINSLSGFTVAASGALNALIVGGGGTQVKVTGSATLTTASFTGGGSVTITLSGTQVLVSGVVGTTQSQLDSLSGWSASSVNLALTGSGLYATITGLSGAHNASIASSGQQAWNAANNNGINLSGALSNSGTALMNRDFLISGILASGLAVTGSGLYGLITGLSGQAVASYATITNLALTGSGLFATLTGMSGQANINYATVTNLAATGQTLNALTTGLSGQAISTYATISNLALTGSGLYRTITGMSGALVSLIGASAAGVASINGASGVMNLGGAGNVTVTTVGQTITVSGNTGDYALFALKTDVTTTGASLYAVTTGLSGQAIATYATIANLTLTGAALSAVKVTGSNVIPIANLTGIGGVVVLYSGAQVFISGGAGGGGGISQGQLDSLSGWSASAANLALTGSGLYALTTGLSGQAVATYATIANLTQTGVQLYGLITAMSGQDSTNYATKTSLTASGALLSAIQVTGSAIIPVANLTGLGGTQIIYSGGIVFVSGGAGGGGITQGQLDSLSGWSASATNLSITGSSLYALVTGLSGQDVLSYATLANVTQTGAQLESIIASTGSSLYALTTGLSGQAVSTYATVTNLASTGQQAWTAANANGINLSGNLTQTGVQLYGLITAMSGQDAANYATKTSLTTSGTLLSAVQVTGSNVINVVNLTGINGFGVFYSGTTVFLSGNGNTTTKVTGSSSINAVNVTGIGTTIVTYDGTFVRISGTPAGTGAGVTSLNGVTSAVTLIGTGGLQITNVGGNVYVSGLTTTTGTQIVFMNQAGVLSGDTSLLWDETNHVMAVAKTRLHNSGISIAAGDKVTLGTGVIVSESGLTFQSNSLAGGGATLGVTGIAGYGVASVIQSGPLRSQGLIGPALWSKQYTAVVPQTTTAVTVYGNTAATVGTISTISTEVLGQYTNFASAAATFVVAGSAVTTPYYFRGTVTGRNGFFFTSTFSFADGTNITGAYGQPSGSRFFIGMTDQSATASVITNDPAGNRVGLSYVVATGGTQTDRYNTDWLLSSKNNVTEFTGSAGMNFQTGFYRFSMYAPPFAANNTGIYWQLEDLIRGSGTAGIITGNLPIGSTQMRPNAMLCTISGGAHSIRVNNLYVENAGAT